MAWPSCGHIQHRMHMRCGFQHAPLARATAHFMRTGEADRVANAPCPICNQRWGRSEEAMQYFVTLTQLAPTASIDLPERGCRCRDCREAGVGPQENEEPINPYHVELPSGAPRHHAVAYCEQHDIIPMNWEVNQQQSGWTGSWSCHFCDQSLDSAFVPAPRGVPHPCRTCRHARAQRTTTARRNRLPGTCWQCDGCRATLGGESSWGQ